MTTVINRVPLAGLQQAVDVMDLLVKRRSVEVIARLPGFDEQLVTMLVLFLRHNHWMAKTDGRWAVTPRGMLWRSKVNNGRAAQGCS